MYLATTLKRILSIGVLALLAFLVAASPARASTSQSISFEFYSVRYRSILGGELTGAGNLAGSIVDDSAVWATPQIFELAGTVTAPLQPLEISVAATGLTTASDQVTPVFWQLYQCGPLGCTYQSGTATFAQHSVTVPVTIDFGGLRGPGTLSWQNNPTCSANCPPPGAWYWVPGGGAQSSLSGTLLGQTDSGTINAYGIPPTIR
jgi:hypothetical protein